MKITLLTILIITTLAIAGDTPKDLDDKYSKIVKTLETRIAALEAKIVKTDKANDKDTDTLDDKYSKIAKTLEAKIVILEARIKVLETPKTLKKPITTRPTTYPSEE